MTGTKFPSCGFTSRSRLIYDPYPPKFKMSNGNWDLDPKPSCRSRIQPNSTLGNYYVDASSGADLLRWGRLFTADGHARTTRRHSTWPLIKRASAGFPTTRMQFLSSPLRDFIIGVSARSKKLQIVETLDRKGGKPDRDVPLGAIGDRARRSSDTARADVLSGGGGLCV